MPSDPQLELFAPTPGVAAEPERPPEPPAPAPVPEDMRELGQRLPRDLRLGTSSWSFPGWTGLVYAQEATTEVLAREGLPAYARHPLLRTVGVDRTFYGPVPVETFRAWAQAVPDDFRFLVKAHEALTLRRFPMHDRYGARRGEENPSFLDPAYARDAVVAPMIEGLASKAGALLLQFPPQDVQALGGPAGFADRLHAFLAALPPGALYAVELRNRALYTSDEEARELYWPFDRLVNENPSVRGDIADLAVEAISQGRPAYVSINNKAEGSAPVSVERLAVAVMSRLKSGARR